VARRKTLAKNPYYPLTDAQWRAIEESEVVPPPKKIGRPSTDARKIINGILWIQDTEGSWRNLPPEYQPWKTAYHRMRVWTRNGVWQEITNALKKVQQTHSNAG